MRRNQKPTLEAESAHDENISADRTVYGTFCAGDIGLGSSRRFVVPSVTLAGVLIEPVERPCS